ncbi:hypothetical protein DAEQUDRAFT_721233 [Daedalea quercina L-15889]|uniref:Uncharacterized protein n=1 Tax=Daedalea quercina L-15889 TaxID=1314783 RepID=A0A165TQ33_9APHY|nr:hypothetical protein DAEQUDRAFT_721233 [Daedalea quercina L-15889]
MRTNSIPHCPFGTIPALGFPLTAYMTRLNLLGAVLIFIDPSLRMPATTLAPS